MTEEQVRKIIQDEMAREFGTAFGVLTFGKHIKMLPNKTFTFNGGSLGASTTDKIAFHGSTPVVQRASASQDAVSVAGATQTTPYGYSTAAQANAIVTLVNEIRAALVEKGLIKGSA